MIAIIGLLLLLCIAYLSIHNFEDRVTLLSKWSKENNGCHSWFTRPIRMWHLQCIQYTAVCRFAQNVNYRYTNYVVFIYFCISDMKQTSLFLYIERRMRNEIALFALDFWISPLAIQFFASVDSIIVLFIVQVALRFGRNCGKVLAQRKFVNKFPVK